MGGRFGGVDACWLAAARTGDRRPGVPIGEGMVSLTPTSNGVEEQARSRLIGAYATHHRRRMDEDVGHATPKSRSQPPSGST